MQTSSSLFTLKLKVEIFKFMFFAELVTNKNLITETGKDELISQDNIKR